MNEFNGKQFYGFSMNSDRNFSTTTRNLEFQHFRPEFHDRNPQKSQRDHEDTGKIHMRQNNFHRLGRPESRNMRRDADVETHIRSTTSPTYEIPKIRELSDQEIDSIITNVKKSNETYSKSPRNKNNQNVPSPRENYHKPVHSTSPLISPTTKQRGILRRQTHDDDETFVRVENLNETYNLPFAVSTNLSKNKTIQKVDYVEINIPSSHEPQIIENVRMEEYRKPQAKWVEIVEPSKEQRLESNLPQSAMQSSFNYGYYTTPMGSQMSMKHQANLMTEVIVESTRLGNDYMNVNPYVDNETADTYIVEDSDLELELLEREHYSKFIKSKPAPEEMLNWSIDDGGSLAEFIAIESGFQDMDVTYLRNASPLRFTEITEDTTEDQNGMKIYINGQEKLQEPFPQILNDRPVGNETYTTCDRSSSPSKSFPQSKRTTKTLREQHLQRTFERLAAGRSARSTTPCVRSLPDENPGSRSFRIRKNCPSPPQSQAEVGSCTSRVDENKPKKVKGRVLPKILRISKSIENLKRDKSNIFKKMSENQEKIIEVLDKLRINLLELSASDTGYDKSKRQKNAFEFAVRFSRNFLYPLKGMLEDITFTPIEQFNSLTSNDACNRVCYMYGLILQSLNIYQKQVRYFHLDYVPQKLPILIDMICTATSLCLEKNIFSQNDVIVDCLLQRCTKFLEFLQDLQDGRLNTTREKYRKLTLDKAVPKYDLKMYMNDLNMYEPKLVPKVRTARKKIRTKRHIASVPIEEVKDILKEMPRDDTIPTQIENLTVTNKSSTQFDEFGSGDGALPILDKTVLEALQNVTKEQVRTILEPLMASLGTALGNQARLNQSRDLSFKKLVTALELSDQLIPFSRRNNPPVAVEAIVNAFQNKVLATLEAEKQLNDANKCSQENKAVVNAGSLGGWTCKPLKAAKQTKTLPQQNNSRSEAPPPSLTEKHFETITTTTAGTGTGSNIAAAAVVAIADVDDDDSTNNNINNDSNNNKSNNDNRTKSKANNSLSQSSGRHSITSQRSRRVVVVADDDGETNNTPPTPTASAAATAPDGRVRVLESIHINKSTKKLLNEVLRIGDQIDKQLTTTKAMKHHQQRRRVQKPEHYAHRSSSSCSTSDCDFSPSNREADHNPILRKYHSSSAVLNSNNKHHPNVHTTPPHPLANSRRGQSTRRTSSHSQCQLHTQTISRNAASAVTVTSALSSRDQRNSLQLTGTKAKLNTPLRLRKKCDPLLTPPPAPSVTPSSSSGHLSGNKRRETHQDDDNVRRRQSPQRDDNMMTFLLDELVVPLTSNATDLLTMRTEGQSLPEEQSGVTQLPDGISNTVGTTSGTSYAEVFKKNALPLYINNSPYNTPKNTPRSRLRPLPEKELQKLKPKPASKPQATTTHRNESISMKENLSPYTQLPSTENSRNTEDLTKPDRRFDDVIRKRNQYLKLCENNRFYKNPNFTEPWNVFSTISEMLLNEVLDTVENDFSAGVSKFVEDFLELETKTQQ